MQSKASVASNFPLVSCFFSDSGYGRSFLVKRVEWGARPSPKFVPLATPVDNVIIHHTAGDASTTPSANASAVRYQQRQHIDHQGQMACFEYDALVAEYGKAYEGRGWTAQGQHTADLDKNSIGMLTIASHWF
ncbi:hypothetical protein CAPTEDRAFT_170792 [Capitella teleta]|uniref:Peptidoglycan recognition protein family domain-containing protein n=1 Tax=Capitella teleta TaxID=283909 RepID=R7UNR6_CAPTE|nr:hypothetical protein CAPTEDRAFT_170792 [Capitella teleta]|eukprot:ELU07753.1 hypothetical protein CAPTEDRAFT_170792 [Capitella teleta]